MTITQLKNIILEAFVNVKLGDGVSLRQSKGQSNYGRDYEEYRALMRTEIRDNWRVLSYEELEKYGEMSFFDAEAFRYYIPAFMIVSLSNEDVFTEHLLFSLNPTNSFRGSWEYSMMQYSLLDNKQNEAVALYLTEIPNIFSLEPIEKGQVTRAVRNYWGQFLPKKSGE